MAHLLSVAEAARVLGVVPATVRQMERDGRLPAEKTEGGMRVFRRGDVERLAAERMQRNPRGGFTPSDGASGKEPRND